MNVIKFSVIIISYKNLQVLTDCLDSLYKFNDIGDKLEIIIIDNSPNEFLYEHIKIHYGKVKIFKNSNKGFGEANNIGAKKAKGEYLLFLNPDTILVEPIFDFAIEKFEMQKKLALFGLKLIDINKKRNMSFYFIYKTGFIYSQLTKLFNKLDLFIDGKMFISGADIFIRKNVFINSGMFDENIFMYNEEADLTRRIKRNGWNTEYYSTKSIIHLEGKSSSDNESSLKMRLVSSQYYCEKYNLNFEDSLKRNIRYDYMKYLVYKFLDNKKSEIYKKNISIFKEFLQEKTEV